MEKVIQIDIDSETELYERYNSNQVSSELVEYIIDSARECTKKDTIKLEINKQNIKEECIPLIKEGLKLKYRKNEIHKNKNDIKQFFMLLGGAISLMLSTILGETIFNEIALIGGWVLIWETIESNLFDDSKTKMENKLIERILKSEFIEK